MHACEGARALSSPTGAVAARGYHRFVPAAPTIKVDSEAILGDLMQLSKLPKLDTTAILGDLTKLQKLPMFDTTAILGDLTKLPKLDTTAILGDLPKLQKLPKLDTTAILGDLTKLPKLPKLDPTAILGDLTKLQKLPKLDTTAILGDLTKLPRLDTAAILGDLAKLPSIQSSLVIEQFRFGLNEAANAEETGEAFSGRVLQWWLNLSPRQQTIQNSFVGAVLAACWLVQALRPSREGEVILRTATALLAVLVLLTALDRGD